MKRLIIALIVALLPTMTSAQLHTMRNKVSNGYDFWLYLPESYKDAASNKRAERDAKPIVLFLHGRSLSGNDLSRVLNYGPLDALEAGLDIDAVIIAPQSPGGWWDPKRAMAVVEWVEQNYNVDPTRLYVLGMSLGGYGTIDFAATYPDKTAAAIALCGGSTLRNVEGLRDVPLWIMHGTADKDVPVEASRRVKRLLKEDGRTPRLRYQELIGVNHSLLARVFYLEECYKWLFDHKLTGKRRVNRWVRITRRDMKSAYEGLRRGSVEFDIVDTKAPKSNVTQSDNKVVADGYYIVKKGDSLWRIATNHGITVDELCKLNNIKSTDIIKPGDKLKVKR